ncbi:winged helix-turn-helix domain-containing protein [Nocardioides euryhalodurans]|uniref:Winged helix family transcriptional regulator n=1 Tax=Nocardioides euryhalodurans TaxID=2518370 RepID=A0A4P7GI34_9ACTN|nr:winged helix-turn-helix domain-containing protein [Nocardioides euryhalodurans]QBR91555.1 winged helix family transcriptional regulator [Nocardioides euryhalodurans]
MVIAIAASMEERLRVASLVSEHVPVLLVATREEALALLAGEPPPAAASVSVVPDPPPTGEVAETLVVDSDWRLARWGEASIPLSPLEHDLLVCLLDEPDRTWTFERIHRRVWGNDHLGGRDDVQSVVKRLRRKLRDLGSPYAIRAVRGVGLRVVDQRVVGPHATVDVSDAP